MQRTTAIVLVMMGADVAMIASAVAFQPSQACRDARAAQRPDADALCGTGHGGGHGNWHAWFGNSTTTTTEAAHSGVERGGFGATGQHAGGGG